jgi:perosamine synthetase
MPAEERVASPRTRGDFLPFHLPEIDEAEVQAVVHVLRSGWLTTGPQTKQFELEFARFVGAQHAVAVNSCTGALHLALEAVGVGPGDEVLVPTLTFAATASVVAHLGARPVLVDSAPGRFVIDPEGVAAAVTPRTRAIIPVHFAGEPCDMDPLLAIARQHGLRIIEDAAHSLPASYRGRPIGTIGDVTCFSFYATKTITTGEGGMAVTDDAALAERMRIMCLHGISKDAWKRYSADGNWYYEVMAPGYKYNLTDIASALGRAQLHKCSRFNVRRGQIAAAYNQAFAQVPELVTPSVPDDVESAWHLYVLQLDLARLRIGRDEFIQRLKTANVGTSVHFIPVHMHPYYRDAFGYTREQLPNASGLFDRIVSLPIYPRMTDDDVAHVIEAVTNVVAQSRR